MKFLTGILISVIFIFASFIRTKNKNGDVESEMFESGAWFGVLVSSIVYWIFS